MAVIRLGPDLPLDTDVQSVNGVMPINGNVLIDTDDIGEGPTNLYFTSERVDDRINALLQEGAGIDLTYDDNLNTLTIASTITQYTNEMVDDQVAALIQNGTGITWAYSDVANTLTPTVTITQYTDEMAQDAVGGILVDGTTINFTYNDAGPSITAEVQNLDSTYISNFSEAAQDAVGSILTDSAEIDFTYNDGAGTITAALVASSIDEGKLDASVNASLDLADSSAQLSFSTIAVSGQNNVVADSASDTLTVAAGNGVTLTTDAGTDTLTIAVSGTNSGTNTGDQNIFQTIAVSGQSNVVADSTTDTVTLAAGTGIAITTNAGTDTVTISPANDLAAIEALNTNGIPYRSASETWGVYKLWSESTTSPTYPTASGTDSMARGNTAVASANYALADGFDCTASAVRSKAEGYEGRATLIGSRVVGLPKRSVAGDRQVFDLYWWNVTTNSTNTELFLDGASIQALLPNNTNWAFDGFVTGTRTDVFGESLMHRYWGTIHKATTAASTLIVSGITKYNAAESTPAWDSTVSADTTNGALKITVDGQAAKTITWAATFKIIQVS